MKNIFFSENANGLDQLKSQISPHEEKLAQQQHHSQHVPLNKTERLLHDQAIQKSTQFKKAHAELLSIIIQIDQTRLFEKFLLSSTFMYCTKILNLTEDVTCTLTKIARVSHKVPELKSAIDDGSISISNARQIATIVTSENKTEWLEKAKSLPQRKLQQEVATHFPQQAVHEKMKFISEQRLKLEMGLDQKTSDDFKRAQDLVSQQLQKAATLEETLQHILEAYLVRKDPLVKAQRILKTPQSKEEHEAQQTSSAARRGAQQKDLAPSTSLKNQTTNHVKPIKYRKKRKALPASLIHKITLRDRHQCQARLPDGTLCSNKRWLEQHHIIPVYQGGENSIENLVTLCSFHHKMRHRN